ncbi:unnamed protein product [Rotaria socialis]
MKHFVVKRKSRFQLISFIDQYLKIVQYLAGKYCKNEFLTQKPSKTFTLNVTHSNLSRTQKKHDEISAFLDPALYHYLIRDPQATPTAEKLILKFYENNRITPRSTSSQTTNVTNTSQSSSLKQQSTTIKEKMHLSILNRFLQTCGINETVTTTPMNIQSVYSIKEQMSFYVTKAKQMPNFQQFWTHFGAELPDLARVAKYFSSMQVTSYSSESSFSMSGYINRKNRCSLSSSALRFSMCLKKQYEQTKMKI